MIIKLILKKTFGRERFYGNNELSKTILNLMHKNSFTLEQVKLLKSVGFVLECQHQDTTNPLDNL